MSMNRILLIEDDARLGEMVIDYLGQAGFAVVRAGTAAAGIAELRRDPPDLVLLDLMLPDADGLDVFRRIRTLPGAAARTPVIMLTAKGDPLDRVIGLEVGAEDYVSKPFEPRELLARVRVVLRRGAVAEIAAEDTLRFGRLEIDRGARMARLAGQDLPLTSHQFALLAAMAERPGRVLSREQIVEFAAGQPQTYDPAFDRSVDVHVGRIRAVIEDDVKKPKRIITVRGAGYVFAKAQD
jgi:DNA-binding response OmpR family regulator